MRRDLACSAVLLCIAAFYYAAATGIQTSTLEDEIGPRGLPTVLAALLALVAIVIAVRALIVLPAGVAGEREAEAHWLRAIGMLAIGALYLPVATVLGYWPALVLLLLAVPLYEQFLARLTQDLGKPVQAGEFGTHMEVSLVNDGPVTIIMDSKLRE